jgi:hypothetical protein
VDSDLTRPQLDLFEESGETQARMTDAKAHMATADRHDARARFLAGMLGFWFGHGRRNRSALVAIAKDALIRAEVLKERTSKERMS